MKKVSIFYILVLFVLNIQANQNNKLDLKSSIQIALQKNVMLKQAQNNLEGNKSDILTSYGNLLPQVSASSNISWSRTEDEGGVITIGGITIPLPPTSTESRSYSVGLSSSLTLFDGLSNFAAISQSKLNYESNKYKLERLKQDIVFQTIAKYLTVMKSKKLLNVQEENLKWNKKSLETILERNRLGQVTLADVYQQQVNYGNAELLLIQSKNNFENAKNDLLAYLNLDVTEPYEIEDPVLEKIIESLESDKLENEYSDFTALVNKAFENRYDYLAKKLELESLDYSITIAKSGHFPRLIASLSSSIRSNRLSDLGKSRSYFAGLSLSMPIFSGWSVSNRVQFAEINYKNTQLNLDEMEKSIKLNLKKSFLDLEAAKKKLEVNNKNVLAASENRRINEEKYNLGANTLLNLLISNSQFVQAQNDLISSTYDYLLIKKQLEYLLGTLEY